MALTEAEEILLASALLQEDLERVSPKLEAFRKPARVKGCRGGRGAGAKSWSIASLLIQRAHHERVHIACLREVQLTLEESVWKLMKETIDRLRYSGWRVTREAIDNQRTGSHIIFRGVSDLRADQIKSLESFDVFWIEEAQGVSSHSLDVLLPTLRAPNSELWFSMNPEEERDPIIARLWDRPDALCVDLQPGAVDNPWWTAELQKEMEADFARDPDLAEHVWNGAARKQGTKSVLSRAAIRGAMDRDLPLEPAGVVELGVDVARFGDDKTTIYKRQGMKVVAFKKLSGADTQETARQAWDMAGRRGDVAIKVDDDGVGCVTGTTQILTPLGWRRADALRAGDAIYTRAMDGNVVAAIVRRATQREPTRIVGCGGYEFSFSHTMPYRTRKEYPARSTSWENILKRGYVILDDEFKYDGPEPAFVLPEYGHNMPHGGRKTTQAERAVDGMDFCRFLGWFVSEGSLWHKRKTVVVSQTRPEHRPEIERLMRLFGGVRVTTKDYVVANAALYTWLKRECYRDGLGFLNKTVPRFVANSSKRYIEAFLDAFCNGDGFRKGGVRYYVTSGRHLKGDLEELTYKIGKRCGVYVKSVAGSQGNIAGRTITRTADNFCIFEYQQRASDYATCLNTVKEPIREHVGIVYELSITGPSKLFFTKCGNNKPIWTHNGGVTDKLRDLGAYVVPVHNGGTAVDEVRFTTSADEQWFGFAAIVDKVDIPDDPDLMQELSGRQYAYTRQDQRKVESKADFKKRYGHSPDSADGLLLCFYAPDVWVVQDGASAASIGL